MSCFFSTNGNYSCTNINENFSDTTTNTILIASEYNYTSSIVDINSLSQALLKNYNNSKIPSTTLLEQYQKHASYLVNKSYNDSIITGDKNTDYNTAKNAAYDAYQNSKTVKVYYDIASQIIENASYGMTMVSDYLRTASELKINYNSIINSINDIKINTNQNYNDAYKYSRPIINSYNDAIYYSNIAYSNFNSRQNTSSSTNSGTKQNTSTSPTSPETVLKCGANYYSISDTECCPNNTTYNIKSNVCIAGNSTTPATTTIDKISYSQTYNIPKNKSDCIYPNELYGRRCWSGCNGDPKLKSYRRKCYNCPDGYSYDQSKSICAKCSNDYTYNPLTNNCVSNTSTAFLPTNKY